MTTPTALLPIVRTGSLPATEEAPRCAACPHSLATHDAIGVRFCSATASGGFERGCVCPT